VLADQIAHGDCPEISVLEIDQIHVLWGVSSNLIYAGVHAQHGLIGNYENRVVVRHTVDSARAQSRNEPQESVFSVNTGRPPELVVAECDSGEGREEVAANALPHDLLD